LVWMAIIFCMFLAAYPPMMATLLWLRKMCIWLRKGYIGHHKIWWGYGYTTPPCLHWCTTVVTRRRRNSSKWWHIILLCTSFLGHKRSYFSLPTQEVLPLTNLFSPQEKVLIFHPIGANLLWTFWSLLSHLYLYIFLSSYTQSREVPGRRCFGFLVIPGLKEIANMER
jgi:hypothetical protein